MTLIAKKYQARSGAMHLRVKQTQYSDAAKERLRRIGSPARWIPGTWEWDCPLTPASVVALDAAAKDLGETVQWEEALRDFADQHLKQSETEHAVRLGIERIIRENIPLDTYPTRMHDDHGQPLAPLRHQQVSWHWSQRVRGLLLAHDPGTGKTRSSTDAAGGWYRNGIVRPMTSAFVNGKHGVQGGVLVVTPKTMLKTWEIEVSKWQNAQAIAIHGSSAKKQRLAATPAHFHVINYETLKYVIHNEYDGLIIDECFPAGSRVATPNGEVEIQNLSVGDMVLAYDHKDQTVVQRKVTHVFCNPRRTRLRSIRTEQGGFVCTANHPIWVDGKGYIPASQVVEGDVVAVLRADPLCGVRRPESSAHRPEGVRAPASLLLAGLPASRPVAYSGGDEPPARFGADEGAEPDAVGSGAGAVVDHVEGDEARSPRSRGQWQADQHGVGTVPRLVAAYARVVHASDTDDLRCAGAAEQREGGCIEPVADARGGVERGLARGLVEAGPGPAEDRVSPVAGVGGDDLHQPGGARRAPDGHAADQRQVPPEVLGADGVVYNLEVEGEHNYFVSGILVHNCHRCANSTHQTHYVLDLSQRAKRVLGLSGTPISNSLESIFYPALIIDGGKALGPSRKAFVEKFFRQIGVGGGFTKNVPLDDAVRQVSERIAEFTYFVKKEEVLDLPPKTHTPVYLEMTDEQERYYHQIKNEAVTYIQDASVTVEQAAARMMKLMQICQGFALADDGSGRHFSDAKTAALADLLANELSSRKVVVWGYFNYEIERLTKMLMDRGIPHIRIDGTVTSQRARDDAMDRWNTDPNLRVYIRQLSMSEGVTLHAKDSQVPCYDCIYLALSYRYVDWKQSQDRIHRIGQKHPCSYTYFLTAEGIDRAVYNAVLAKDAVAGQVQNITKDYYLSLLNAKF